MPKYEIEIPDGVLPEGMVPVAYRKPEPHDVYLCTTNSTKPCRAPKGLFGDKEAFLIVERKPETKFKVGDKVRCKGETHNQYMTIRTAETYEGKPRYRLTYENGSQGTCYWFDDELEPYTEPQETTKYQVGQIVSYQQGHYPKQQWVIRDIHRTPLTKEPVYKIRPVGPVHPVLNAEIFVDERDLSPYVEKPRPEPKFKVGDWVTVGKWGFHRIEKVWWNTYDNNWWYDFVGTNQCCESYLKPTTRVPLTQDDAVKLALGEITPKDIQLEDKRFKTSLADRTVSTIGKREAGITLWLRIPGQHDTSSGYPISDLTRLV